MIDRITTIEPETSTQVHVLVVDDRPEGLLALEAIFSDQNYNLIKAKSGREALQYCAYYDFAVILLDVQMPELDGFQTARLLRESSRSKETPIIFVTAINKETRHIHQGYESGAVDYVFKPFDPFILKSKVDVFVQLFKKDLQLKGQADLLRKMELQEKERQLSEFRQESLRQYANLADAVPLIIIKVDINGTIEYANQRWHEYTGSHPSDFEWEEAVDPQDRRKLLAFWLKMRQKNWQKSQIEIRLRRMDGVCRWHLLKMVAEVKNGKIIGWIGTCMDIDNIKKTEEKFRMLSEDLNRSNKELEQFAFIASHDLQEPLRIVSSYVDLLLLKHKGKLDPKAMGTINIIKTGVTRSQRLIRDLLEYARIGMKEKVFCETRLDAALSQAMFNISLLIKERGAEVTYDPLPVLGIDVAQMVQVFQNLLMNSLKYCESRPRIHIEARKTSQEWIFSISDNGIGIDAQYYEKVFVIFQRLHCLNKYQGTGIGLAICKKIIERHGGRIWLESELNKGTTFYFSLPRRRE